jgi:hypothetical protein
LHAAQWNPIGSVRPRRVEPVAELPLGVGPLYDRGPGFGRQPVEGGAAPVLRQQREKVEQRTGAGSRASAMLPSISRTRRAPPIAATSTMASRQK